MIQLACMYGRYGYRRIGAMLRWEGWRVNHKRIERLWRCAGLKVPQKQPKRRRLWFNDGSCIRLRPERPNHVWSYDFVTMRTEDSRAFRILTVIDEFTHECLALPVARKFKAHDIQGIMSQLFLERGVPEYIRSDNGPEFVAEDLKDWLPKVGVKTLFIEPGSPWENGYNESFNGKLRFDLLDGEIFDTLWEARVVLERWRKEYNTRRPHSSLGQLPPAPEAWILKPKTEPRPWLGLTNPVYGVT
jgi:transposase InsO family protein